MSVRPWWVSFVCFIGNTIIVVLCVALLWAACTTTDSAPFGPPPGTVINTDLGSGGSIKFIQNPKTGYWEEFKHDAHTGRWVRVPIR
jgi:hypothetical protein